MINKNKDFPRGREIQISWILKRGSERLGSLKIRNGIRVVKVSCS